MINAQTLGIITQCNMFDEQTGFSDEKYEGRRETDQQICSTKQIANNENIHQYIQRQIFDSIKTELDFANTNKTHIVCLNEIVGKTSPYRMSNSKI